MRTTKRRKTIILDFDDTLIKSSELFFKKYNSIHGTAYYPSDELYRTWNYSELRIPESEVKEIYMSDDFYTQLNTHDSLSNYVNNYVNDYLNDYVFAFFNDFSDMFNFMIITKEYSQHKEDFIVSFCEYLRYNFDTTINYIFTDTKNIDSIAKHNTGVHIDAQTGVAVYTDNPDISLDPKDIFMIVDDNLKYLAEFSCKNSDTISILLTNGRDMKYNDITERNARVFDAMSISQNNNLYRVDSFKDIINYLRWEFENV